MEIFYTSTRDQRVKVLASQAIMQGLSEDGGLFVPTTLPVFDFPLEKIPDFSYQELAYRVMRLLLTDFTEQELRCCIDRAYDDKFDTPQIAPLVKAGDSHYLELFHGKTIAFKDMALSILPHLMKTAAKKHHVDREIVILTATSGDTGKAALAGFADVPGTSIVVFYPKAGVSAIQEKQMVTQKGDNTFVVGIKGNFDQAQSGVKALFSDEALRGELADAGFQFSSANSINIGRLVPQIVYYVYAYGQMVRSGQIQAGDSLQFVVPTGNFGNILAAYYAKRMGLPVGKLICASNENKVLFDFFRTGTYDKNRPFILTTSPSMDILISSNLERLIFHIAGDDAKATARLMEQLAKTGTYEITEDMRSKLTDFAGCFADQRETAQEIKRVFDATGYVLDPHTAVASGAAGKYEKEAGAHIPAVIISTASPYKFTRSVLEALEVPVEGADDFALADQLARISHVKVPDAVEEIRRAPVLHRAVIAPEQMKETVKEFLAKRG